MKSLSIVYRLVKNPNQFGLLMVFLFLGLAGHAQNKSVLKDQIGQLEKEIKYTNDLISETQKDREMSVVQIRLLTQQIGKQENLVLKLRLEIQLVEEQMAQHQLEVSRKEKELVELKDEYAKMIVYSQKNMNRYDRLMFVFASKDFNQAFKRMKYFEQYSQYRKQQAQIISDKKAGLQASIAELSMLKAEKEALRIQEESEISQINKKKISHERGLKELKGKEKELKASLKKKNQQRDKLKKEIEKILAAEAKKVKETKLTPDQVKLAQNFEDNKGKLPWPVVKGVVYSSFGEHDHPVLKGIKTRNDGVDLVTNEGSHARAIFDGEVRSIISVPGSANFAVLVKHGNYFSLYSNLAEVFVKPGDKVATKQDIGKIAKDPEDNTTKLQFQIWKSTSKLNPILWLAQ
jgi:septal ring factor EnvC (AmiA/AmiB activator)